MFLDSAERLVIEENKAKLRLLKERRTVERQRLAAAENEQILIQTRLVSCFRSREGTHLDAAVVECRKKRAAAKKERMQWMELRANRRAQKLGALAEETAHWTLFSEKSLSGRIADDMFSSRTPWDAWQVETARRNEDPHNRVDRWA